MGPGASYARGSKQEGVMPDACGRTFDETFLSGYLDRALVQEDEQRVLLAGGVSGVSLILISVFLDRRHAMKTDRYREVRR